jgi:hypothetical protein
MYCLTEPTANSNTSINNYPGKILTSAKTLHSISKANITNSKSVDNMNSLQPTKGLCILNSIYLISNLLSFQVLFPKKQIPNSTVQIYLEKK